VPFYEGTGSTPARISFGLSVSKGMERPAGWLSHPIELSDPVFRIIAVTGLLKVLPVAFCVGGQEFTPDLSQAASYPGAPSASA
jgi:hypothetical protein